MHWDARRVVRHYLPVLAGLAVFAVIVAVVPSVPPTRGATGVGTGTVAAAGPVYPAGDAPGDPGTAVSGVPCGHGHRQVIWSRYAPLCQPAFTGDNGGSTSPGVTAKTITITFRYAATPAEVALLNQVAPGTLPSEQQALSLMQTYIALFNRSFDLYGRKVVLKSFSGQGDVMAELAGTGQAAAEADAATAKSMGAFADVSGTIFNTQPYDDALAAQGIVSVGGLFESASYLQRERPYEYAPGPDCEKAAEAATAVVGRDMVGLPAVYAGDAATAHQTRTFGLISPDNAIYQACGQALATDLASRYGVHLKDWIRYTIDLSAITQAAANALNMVSQLKAAGVTTVICGCDPITPLFLAQDAEDQDYHPEWLSLSFGDTFSRLLDGASTAAEWDHSLSVGIGAVPPAEDEALLAYRLATGSSTDQPPASYQYIYEPLLLLFDGLQAAGPHLTPQTFEAGMDSLPPSLPGGQFGPWSFGPGTVDPGAGAQVLRWSSTAVSPLDGKAGTGLACNGGAVYLFADDLATLPDHRQLACPPAT